MLLEAVGEHAAADVGVQPDEVEPLAHVSGDLRDRLGREAELRVGAGGDLLVVAGPDPGVDPDRDAAVVAALGQPVEGVPRAGGDRQSRVVGRELDGVVEVAGRRVDGRVAQGVGVGPGVDRPLELPGGRALDVRARLQHGLEHRPARVGLRGVHHAGVGERGVEPAVVRPNSGGVEHVQRRPVGLGDRFEPVFVPVGEPADRRPPLLAGGRAHPRSASSRAVASSVSASRSVATTAGLYAPPSNSSWSPTLDSTNRVNARRSGGSRP